MNRAFRGIVRRRSSLAKIQSSPKYISASEIRKSFIDYFCEDHKHFFIPSSPVFSLKDPTLAFTNAGMNQFKDIFLGTVQPGFSRAVNFQKCIRIGGVHNDLDQVGQDGCHHTFFEMLGNWSFGDYFKEEACRMSWDLLTKVYNLSPDRLYVTYFKGNETLGLDPDIEVQEIWRKIGVAESHILPFGIQDNFWTGSVTGPCGPCTEIHYDHCPGRTNVGNLVNAKCAEVTELWNLVFIQYDKKANGELIKLNRNFVDTGMGFERLVAVLQGKISNYDTDLFLPLFEVIRKHSGRPEYTGKFNSIDCGYRTLADHSRMIAMALSDGSLPNHQSKVRGIIKKTLNAIEKLFDSKPDLLKELTTEVAQILSDAYPEIEKNLPKIHYIIDNEVEIININKKTALNKWAKMKNKFPALHDLDITEIPQVLTGLDYISKNILNKGKNEISSDAIFVLYDTYGIPVNITEQIALKLGLNFDLNAFKEYERLKKEKNKKEVHDKYIQIRSEYSYLDIITDLEKKKIQPTRDYFKYDYRVDGTGKYIFKDQPTTIEAIICNYILLDEISSEDITENQEIGLVLDRTQLFSQDGGQVCDRGTLEIENEIIFEIKGLVKVKDFVIHFGNFRNFPRDAKVSVQSIGVIKIDEDRRLNVMKNHTALHLLNAFLREEIYVCGEKFSEVTPEKIFLNFMVYRRSLNIPQNDIKKLEKYVRDVIKHGVSVKRRILNHSQFRSMDDVVCIPGEYMLKHEIPVIEINSGFKLSREYCTGTHVLNVSHIKDFIVTNYVKGSYNINTIEAVTGEKTLQIRKSDSEAEKKWSDLEKKISECAHCNPSVVDNLILQVKKFSLEISESSEISYLTKFAISNAIQQAKSNFNSLKKSSVRNFLAEELKKASLETSEKFLVLSWKRCWDFDPGDLEMAASSLTVPLLMFLTRGDSAAVQCVVPQDFVSQKFSAQKWLVDSLISFGGGIAEFKKHQNPDLIYFMADRKMTEMQLIQAVDTAVYLAKKNIEK